MLLNTILEAVGHTPIVRLHRVGKELPCELYGKCEFLNPGGSVKDRIAVKMIEAAEKSGKIKPGDTLIEATSGNTGIGFALAAAVKGYHLIITMPEKMSHEKEVVLEALGAKIYRTPTAAKWDDPDSHISLAKKLQQEIPNAHILDQYTNDDNPNAHSEHTAEEILADMGKDLAMVVMTVGTGGTITGVARRLKKEIPQIQIIGVDPYGSILGGGTEIHPYLVEGIGYDFFPPVLDNSLVDEYVKVNDENSFLTARRLIREEGLLIGGSSGSAVWAALQVAKRLDKGQKCLVILPDNIRNYLSKFVDKKWMREQGFIHA
ncbi:MAG: pyridoxal-phosphate dependent enzyme [Gammaproteobacteria bacterium]|nr:MAG: pyridoxal-phosphate dependent enzyme [Gammaproteobacteria bacterium]